VYRRSSSVALVVTTVFCSAGWTTNFGDVPFIVETLDGLSGENVGGWV